VAVQCHPPHLLQPIEECDPVHTVPHPKHTSHVYTFDKIQAGFHFTYIKARDDEHKQQLQLYYKLTEQDLEKITKEWLVDLLVVADPVEMFDVDSPEAMLDTPGPSKTKKDGEVQDVHSTSMKTTSISPVQRGNGEEIGGTKVEQNKGEVTPPREEEDPSKKRKITPPNPSS
jgi:hypothetical protein